MRRTAVLTLLLLSLCFAAQAKQAPPAPAPGTIGLTVFNDRNNDGAFGSSDYSMEWEVRISRIGEDGSIAWSQAFMAPMSASVEPGFYLVEARRYMLLEVDYSQWVPTTPVAYEFSLVSGQTAVRTFGFHRNRP